ncbi:hypothetical protein ABZW49_17340 [Nonomuraea wenchangensis]
MAQDLEPPGGAVVLAAERGPSQAVGSRNTAGALRFSSVLDIPGCAATATVVPCGASRRCSS